MKKRIKETHLSQFTIRKSTNKKTVKDKCRLEKTKVSSRHYNRDKKKKKRKNNQKRKREETLTKKAKKNNCSMRKKKKLINQLQKI